MNLLISALLSTAFLLLTTIYPGISPAQEVNQFTIPGTSGIQGTPGTPGTSLPSGIPSVPEQLTPEQQKKVKGYLPQKLPVDKKAKGKEGAKPEEEMFPEGKPRKVLSPFEEYIQGKTPHLFSEIDSDGKISIPQNIVF